ncbi:unnamed protein product [Pieris macdunnoughi]|uniref:Uncharacterized protein n=1 Tax=Pieris macdunnoughi TaxID=345717 RepID=A0A821XSL2_9NEOP|nr:unnamed protein product [Pieris macdunnoughi]
MYNSPPPSGGPMAPSRMKEEKQFRVEMPGMWFAQFEAADNRYNTSKERLLQVYEESAQRQFQKLVSELELGSQKPTQLLRRMKDLGRTTQVSEQMLKNLWRSRMPSEVRAVIAVCQDQAIDNFAAIGDKIIENCTTGEIATIAGAPLAAPQMPAVSDTLTGLVQQLNNLTLEVAALRSEVQDRGRPRSRSHQSYKSRSTSRK